MVVKNGMSRFHLCQEALRRARRRPPGSDELIEHCDQMQVKHQLYIHHQHFEDLPKIRDWTWAG